MIVVSRTSPLGESVLQEVVVALPRRALQDVGNDSEPLVSLGDLLHMCFDFLLRRLLGDFDAILAFVLVLQSIGGSELLASLVRVDGTGLLAVGFIDIVLRRRGLETEQVVESDVCTIVGCYLVAEFEYFVVCEATG